MKSTINTTCLTTLFIVYALLATGCQMMPLRDHQTIEPEIIEAIAIDLFGVVLDEIPPLRGEVTILVNNAGEEILDKLMRTSGYRVNASGIRNVTTLSIFHLQSTDTYIGTVAIGLYTRFTRQYRYYPEGLVQIGSTAVGS